MPTPHGSSTTLRASSARGQRTHHEILAAALRMASLGGLEAVTIGALASELNMSKAGLFAHFGSKEALQLATVDAAFQSFFAEVVAPAFACTPGITQLEAFAERYLAYVETRVLPGGCFFSHASLEFDDREGPVRDRIREGALGWRAVVDGAVKAGQANGEIDPRADATQLAFETGALLQGTIIVYQLFRDPEILARARRAMQRLFASVRVSPKRDARSNATRKKSR